MSITPVRADAVPQTILELLQLSNVSSLQFSEEVYFDVIRKKTAVLFAMEYIRHTFALPVTIEDGCWIGGGVIILPGRCV